MAFIGIDWGTTSLRAFLITPDGEVLARQFLDKGIKQCQKGEFPEILNSILAQWPELSSDAKIVMCGMIGSAQGWHEAAYLTADVTVSRLAQSCVCFSYQHHAVYIIPGLCLKSFANSADVMRGEETIYLGAAQRASSSSHYYCLPGTHSKWIHAENGAITAFASFMTGELFEWASTSSMLAPVLEKPEKKGELDTQAFCEGVTRSENELGLLHHLFSVRAEIVSGEREGRWGYAMVSGLIIGAEIKAMAHLMQKQQGEIVIVCTEQTKQLYLSALQHYRLNARHIDAEKAVINGLYAVHQHLDSGNG